MMMKTLQALIFFCSFILSSCKQLKTVLPKGPALGIEKRQALVDIKKPSYTYTSENVVDFPVIPFQIWALTYDLDIILVSDHPTWNMHEFAMIQTIDGPKWLMKDAYEGSLDQVVTADIDDIQTWLPELPITRKKYPVRVVDRSNTRDLDLEFEYYNHEDELVRAFYKGPRPKHT